LEIYLKENNGESDTLCLELELNNT